MKCMSMGLKDFQKNLNSTQIFQKKFFNQIVLKNTNIKHILH